MDPELEAALRQVLRPEEPPAGFADRVMARAGVPIAAPREAMAQGAGRPGAKVLAWPVRRVWVGGAVAAAVLLGCFEGGEAWHRVREQQRRVAAATAQFETTERVTVRALAQAREQLQRAGVPITLD